MGLPRTVLIVKDKPEHGELHFTNLHLATLQNKFGPDWLMSAPDRCNRCDMEFLQVCLEVAGRKGKTAGINLGEIDETIPIGDLTDAVLNAIFIASFGMNFEQRQEWMVAQMKKMREEEERNGKKDESPQPLSPENT